MFFIFQAEDGIRYYKVTGVQTCALPISRRAGRDEPADGLGARAAGEVLGVLLGVVGPLRGELVLGEAGVDRAGLEIGRASCRERVEIREEACALKNGLYGHTVLKSICGK